MLIFIVKPYKKKNYLQIALLQYLPNTHFLLAVRVNTSLIQENNVSAFVGGLTYLQKSSLIVIEIVSTKRKQIVNFS